MNYNEVLYFEQIYATKTESVTPFLVRYWQGLITLNPPIDSWIDERAVTSTSFNEISNRVERSDQNITRTNNVTINREIFVNNPPNPQVGIGGFDWIANARTVLTGITNLGGITLLKNASILANNQSGFTSNFIQLRVWKNQVTNSDRDLIRRLLPQDVSNQFFTQINTRNRWQDAVLNFTQVLERYQLQKQEILQQPHHLQVILILFLFRKKL